MTPIAEARAAPDGATVTIEAVALTESDFHDGGGFVADATGGIAVLLADGGFGPGELLRITGDIDDRFSQRTLRADSAAAVRLGTAAEPAPIAATTGAVDEDLEGRLVRIGGTVQGSPTTLTSGLAFDVDDGSGAIRVVVGTSTGIDPATWHSGAALELVGRGRAARLFRIRHRRLPRLPARSRRRARRRGSRGVADARAARRAAKESCRSPRLARPRSTRRFGSVAS